MKVDECTLQLVRFVPASIFTQLDKIDRSRPVHQLIHAQSSQPKASVK